MAMRFPRLLLAVLLVAAYFAGFTTSQKLAEKAIQEAREKAAVELEKAQETALRAQRLAQEERAATDLANWQLRGNILTK